MNNKPQHKTLSNIPIGCTFCGATVHGKILESKNNERQIKWICPRCSNLVKVGKAE
jgi:DNA-directed RNA polymerase subunit RPC12/RpoP